MTKRKKRPPSLRGKTEEPTSLEESDPLESMSELLPDDVRELMSQRAPGRALGSHNEDAVSTMLPDTPLAEKLRAEVDDKKAVPKDGDIDLEPDLDTPDAKGATRPLGDSSPEKRFELSERIDDRNVEDEQESAPDSVAHTLTVQDGRSAVDQTDVTKVHSDDSSVILAEGHSSAPESQVETGTARSPQTRPDDEMQPLAELLARPPISTPDISDHQVPAESRDALRQASRRVADLEERLKFMDSRIDHLDSQLDLCHGQIAAQLAQLEDAKGDVLTLEAQKSKLEELLRQERLYRDELGEKSLAITRREERLNDLEDSLAEIGASWSPEKVLELELKNQGLERQLTSLKALLNERQDEIALIQDELDRIDRPSVDDLENRNRFLSNHNQALQLRIEQLEQSAEYVHQQEQLIGRASRLESENAELRRKASALEMENNNLRSQQANQTAYKTLYETTYAKLQEHIQQLEILRRDEQHRLETSERAFDALTELTERSEYNRSTNTESWPGPIGLVKHIAKVASKSGFHFELSQIRAFLASITSSRFIILRGFSGTGKSSLPQIIAHALGAPCEVIPVQPSWKSKVDLLGFYNHFDQQFLPTLFTKSLFKAMLPAFQDLFFFILLDEMNLARVEYYFSDFNVKLQDPANPVIELFENASVKGLRSNQGIGRYIENGNQVRIPRNVFFVGTINDDETTFAISDKIYDRAQVIDFQVTSDRHVQGELPKDKPKSCFSYSAFVGEWEEFLKCQETTDKLTNFLDTLNEILRERFYLNLSYRPRGQIVEFVHAYCMVGGDYSDALDLQIVSKVIPKIRYTHRTGFADSLDQFHNELIEHWPFGSRELKHTQKAIEGIKAQLM